MQTTLLNEGPADFEGDLSVETLTDTTVPTSAIPRYTLPARHTPKRVDVFRRIKGKNGKESEKKRRQYDWKVCSLLRPGKNPWKTTFYGVEYSETRARGVPDDSTTAKGRIYLCQKVCQYDPNGPVKSATCSQIWHDLWRGRSSIPPGLKTIRVRAPTGCARRGASESGIQEESESSAEETGSASSDSGVLQIAYI
ncbi:hypothetical protein PC119_g23898 [Phytophthora cactorum]|nr:hypothetical protein PC119_g23898 [Phytophthora cactorum]KAG3128415.1 hypothetical protein C6341_g24561 [Phytophthora cactorum]